MKQIITVVTNNGQEASFFTQKSFQLEGDAQRMLTEQIQAVNFRLRSSDSSYSSSWHVAGDPTLLVILNGVVRIELRNGETKDFKAGEMFIAEDHLAEGTEFDDSIHGHRAAVVGEMPISVLHLKLEKRA